jgi:Family of unknown function (DUF6527)
VNFFKRIFFRELLKLRVRIPAFWYQRRVYTGIRTTDVPDKLESGKVYLIGENDHLWSAALKCPCGCGTVLEINLVPDIRPRWSVAEDKDGYVTIEPSIWRKKDCECHFRITRGMVRWY